MAVSTLASAPSTLSDSEMIFRNIIFSAVLVGLVSGLIYGVFQQTQLSPIIYAAEKFEANKSTQVSLHENNIDSLNPHTETAWSPSNGAERIFWTLLANVLTGISFALVMLSLMAIHNLKSNKPKVDSIQGIGWGAVALLAIFVAPALIGLHPEVPGTVAIGLEHRQGWWLFCVLATALGAAVLYYTPIKFKALGVMLAVIPHIIAAPIHAQLIFENTDPVAVAHLNDLSQQFFSMTAIGTALFFIVLGASSGFAVKKFIHLNAQAI